MNMQIEAALESSRMASLGAKRPLHVVGPHCGLPIHGTAQGMEAGASEWDYIHRATLKAHFGNDDAWRFVPNQWWAWPASNGQPDGDAVVTHTHVTIRSGEQVRSLRASGLATAMRELGLDVAAFEVMSVVVGEEARAA